MSKLPGFHNTTYMQLKSLQQQLKSSIKLKEKLILDNSNNGFTSDTSSNISKNNVIRIKSSPKANNSLNMSNTDSNSSQSSVLFDDGSDLDDFDLTKSQKKSPKKKSIGHHNLVKNGIKNKESILISQTNKTTNLNNSSKSSVENESSSKGKYFMENGSFQTSTKPTIQNSVSSLQSYTDSPPNSIASAENESSNKVKYFMENNSFQTSTKPTIQNSVLSLQSCADSSHNSNTSILNMINESKACLPNSNESPAAKKGKFVFKRPSTLSTTMPLSNPTTSSTTEVLSNTLKKIELAKQNLKPVNIPEPSKLTVPSLNNSSVPFQPSKQASVMTKDSHIVANSPNHNKVVSDYNLVKDCVVMMDSEEEYANADNMECDFSFSNSSLIKDPSLNEPNYSKEPSASQTKPQVEVDEDGWPIYKEEDFANIQDCEVKNSVVVNDTPSVSNQNSNQLGNFYSNVKNDGITGNYSIELS